jgi:DNA-binding MarR family transcriptional regulator
MRNFGTRAGDERGFLVKSTEISDADFHALGAFRHCLRRFLAFSERAARKRGLTSQQHQALLAIAATPHAMSVGELAEMLMIKPHSALELTRRLKRAALIVFAHDANDGRRVLLRLSRKGRARLCAISIDNIAELKDAAPVLRDLIKTLGALQRRRA